MRMRMRMREFERGHILSNGNMTRGGHFPGAGAGYTTGRLFESGGYLNP